MKKKTKVEKLRDGLKVAEIAAKEQNLEGKVKEKPKEKKSKTLFEKLFKKKKLDKPQMVAVVYLRNNRTAEPMEIESKNGMFMIGGKSYNVNQECIWVTSTKERYPLAVIREDSINPEASDEWNDRPIQQKFAEFQDHVIKAIRHAELVREGYKDQKMNLSTKQIIGYIIGGIILVAVVANYI